MPKEQRTVKSLTEMLCTVELRLKERMLPADDTALDSLVFKIKDFSSRKECCQLKRQPCLQDKGLFLKERMLPADDTALSSR
ncbi:hypothetical protein PR048_029671 [Dryococelus australis]|uniref:Uncharacterized protein n=1 Tax=Dryococelus australis TaxID=614101 RepID=A0ABQ9GEC2_9NEOP|nr:hypothetical protein PR048_029671 [Dryococelus australis]